MRVTFEEALRLLRKWRYEDTPIECWFEGDIQVHVCGHVTQADKAIVEIQSEPCTLRLVVPENAELNYSDFRDFQSRLRHSVAKSYEGLLCIRLSANSSLVVGEMHRFVEQQENLWP
jgi:hypothetical protein